MSTIHDIDSMYADHENGVREVFDTDAYDLPLSVATCGECGRSWDDDRVSGLTPTPSGRCPFEYEHGTPAGRLEYLRGALRRERISYGEMAELADLRDHIEPGDVELLEAAGVPEHDDE